MNFKTLLVGLGIALAVSVSHAQGIVYSVVHGKNLDLYYDAAAFGNDVTAVGDSFFVASESNGWNFSVSGNAYVVAHEGVALYPQYRAIVTGEYQLWRAEYIVSAYEAHNGTYYDTNLELVPDGKFNWNSSISFYDYADGNETRTGTMENYTGGRYEWSDKPEFGRIDMYISLFNTIGSNNTSDSPDTYLRINGFTFEFETVSPVPEPETYAMLLAGLGLIAVRARRRKA